MVVLGILVLVESDRRHRRMRAVDGMVGAANDLLAGRVCHKRTTSSDAAIELWLLPNGDRNHEVCQVSFEPGYHPGRSDHNDHRKRGGSEQAQSKSVRPLIALQAVGGMPLIAGDELV